MVLQVLDIHDQSGNVKLKSLMLPLTEGLFDQSDESELM